MRPLPTDPGEKTDEAVEAELEVRIKNKGRFRTLVPVPPLAVPVVVAVAVATVLPTLPPSGSRRFVLDPPLALEWRPFLSFFRGGPLADPALDEAWNRR